MKKDMNDLKRLVYDLMNNDTKQSQRKEPGTSLVLRDLYEHSTFPTPPEPIYHQEESLQTTDAVIEENFSIEDKEKELILRALSKNNGKRKAAAQDLGISERTLYRKLKEYHLEK